MFDKLTVDNVHMFAYTNIPDLKKGKVKAIVMNIHGLGGGDKMEYDIPGAKLYTDRDYGYFYPYCGPWNWMNPNSVKLCDEIVDLFIEALELPEDTPVVATGGSMGGLASLVYAMESRHKIGCVAVSCPVCDLPYHYNERDDIPRTMRCAFGAYGDDLEAVLTEHSPMQNVSKMPHVPYFIAQCELDDDVHMDAHSDRFVPLMQAAGHDVTYIRVPGRGHCSLTEDVAEKYRMFPFEVMG